MKKLVNLMISLVCICMLAGCTKKDLSKKVTGTNEEIAVMLFEDIISGDYDDFYDKYNFTPELDELARSKRFGSILSPYFNMMGKLESREDDYTQDKAKCTFVYFPCHFENGDLNVVITINENQEIANVSFNDYQEDVE